MQEYLHRDEDAREKGPWLTLAALVILLAAGMVYLFYVYPNRRIGPEQPIAFSHRVHAGVKQIDCRFCHPFVSRSMRAGIPSMEKCFFCHEYIIPLHPEIRKERASYDGGIPIPWVRVYYVPDHVQFRHQPHVDWGMVDCVECHGEVEKMDRLPAVSFQMSFCIGCHRERSAQLDCWLACHH
jgi:hypothetical protein